VPQSINPDAALDFSYAREVGCTIRQVARAERAEGKISRPRWTDAGGSDSPLAWSCGTENMVILKGHYGGMWSFPAAAPASSHRGSCGQRPLALAHGSQRVQIPSAPAHVGAEFEVPVLHPFPDR